MRPSWGLRTATCRLTLIDERPVAPSTGIERILRLTRWLQQNTALRAVLAGVVAAGGLGVAAFTLALGHCSAFGGRCPAEPVPLWENDVFGGVGIGVAVSVFALAAAIRPSRRGLIVGAIAAAALGLVAGLWGAAATGRLG